jgi:hypothetical protein
MGRVLSFWIDVGEIAVDIGVVELLDIDVDVDRGVSVAAERRSMCR